MYLHRFNRYITLLFILVPLCVIPCQAADTNTLITHAHLLTALTQLEKTIDSQFGASSGHRYTHPLKAIVLEKLLSPNREQQKKTEHLTSQTIRDKSITLLKKLVTPLLESKTPQADTTPSNNQQLTNNQLQGVFNLAHLLQEKFPHLLTPPSNTYQQAQKTQGQQSVAQQLALMAGSLGIVFTVCAAMRYIATSNIRTMHKDARDLHKKCNALSDTLYTTKDKFHQIVTGDFTDQEGKNYVLSTLGKNMQLVIGGSLASAITLAGILYYSYHHKLKQHSSELAKESEPPEIIALITPLLPSPYKENWVYLAQLCADTQKKLSPGYAKIYQLLAHTFITPLYTEFLTAPENKKTTVIKKACITLSTIQQILLSYTQQHKDQQLGQQPTEAPPLHYNAPPNHQLAQHQFLMNNNGLPAYYYHPPHNRPISFGEKVTFGITALAATLMFGYVTVGFLENILSFRESRALSEEQRKHSDLAKTVNSYANLVGRHHVLAQAAAGGSEA